MLSAYDFVDKDSLCQFLATTKTKYGGYGKVPDAYPDLLHSYMGLSGLALQEEENGLRRLNGALGISEKANEWLKSGTVFWNR
ncbi:Geranylgeranyl transferase type-1 subunit beta [Rhizophlyctis rosea]|nr:Geranylgeranyl transferase type-1 subunit beta [Rhizophlyctis rosea]